MLYFNLKYTRLILRTSVRDILKEKKIEYKYGKYYIAMLDKIDYLLHSLKKIIRILRFCFSI